MDEFKKFVIKYKDYVIAGTIGTVVMLGILLYVYQSSNNLSQSSSPKKQEKSQEKPSPEPIKATFSGAVLDYEIQNPATISFYARVENTSEVAAKYKCKVEAEDASGTYRGYDLFVGENIIQPGEVSNFTGVLTITKEGALWVDAPMINCQPE